MKEHAWKVCVRGNSYQEFESPPLRQEKNLDDLLAVIEVFLFYRKREEI